MRNNDAAARESAKRRQIRGRDAKPYRNSTVVSAAPQVLLFWLLWCG